MKPAPAISLQTRRASALLLVLWAVVTMSLAVLGLVEYVNYNLDETRALNRDFRARQIAESGLAFAFSPQVEQGDPLLQGYLEDDGRYEVKLDSESARLNINFLVKTGREDFLERMFESWKVPSSEARMVTQDIINWMGRTGEDADTFAVEREFESVAQIAEVETMNLIERRNPDWREAFTIWGDGRLDVNKATPEILRGFFGISERQAQRFVLSRHGPDKKENTLDDQPYKNPALIAGALGLSPRQYEPFAPLVGLESQITRAESTGTLGEYHKTIRVIMNRQAQPAVIYLWEEPQL